MEWNKSEVETRAFIDLCKGLCGIMCPCIHVREVLGEFEQSIERP